MRDWFLNTLAITGPCGWGGAKKWREIARLNPHFLLYDEHFIHAASHPSAKICTILYFLHFQRHLDVSGINILPTGWGQFVPPPYAVYMNLQWVQFHLEGIKYRRVPTVLSRWFHETCVCVRSAICISESLAYVVLYVE